MNKQLDFQTLLVESGRDILIKMGWYEERRLLQKMILAATVLIGGSGIILTFWKEWRFFIRNPFSLLGVVFLLFYILLRIVAIDHANGILRMNVPDDASWLRAIELSGIIFLSSSAGLELKSKAVYMV